MGGVPLCLLDQLSVHGLNSVYAASVPNHGRIFLTGQGRYYIYIRIVLMQSLYQLYLFLTALTLASIQRRKDIAGVGY